MAVDLGVSITLRDTSGPSRCNQSKIDSRLWDAMLEVVPREGVEVELQSNLPIGKGMGSSAALSIALIRAIAKREHETYSLEQELELGHRIETHFHGTPSGLDHTVSAMGKGIYYRNAPTGTIIHPFSLPTLKMVVVDSGTSGSTIEMVNMVHKSLIHSTNRQTIDEIGILTNKIYEELTGDEYKPVDGERHIK